MCEHILRSSPLGPPDAELTVLSWNVLAPAWVEPVRYAHVGSEALSWEHRFPLILAEIERTAATVVCLQEVEFRIYEEELSPALLALGYQGAIQSDRKRGSDHPAGNATFWQSSRLRLVAGPLPRSRTLATVLEDGASRRLAVVNCHLEGNPRQPVARVKQLQSSLQQLAGVEHHAALVLGDFNCDLRSSAAAAYLAFGSVPYGVTEWGFEVPAAAGAVPPHGYAMASAYGAELTDEFSFTHRGQRGSVWFLDQLWFTTAALRPLATRSAFAGPAHRQAILESGLPSATEPSDHLPIAAAFRWSAAAGSALPNLGARPAGDAASAGALSEGQSSPANAEDLAVEAAELLAACPITDEQRAEWLAATTPPPELPKGKKPSPEQLAELKELQRRKEALLASVGEEACAMLTRAAQLARKARKK